MIAQVILLISAILLSLVYRIGIKRGAIQLTSLIMNLFTLYALTWILFMVFLWFNHINFPLNLEAMELTVVQHLKRVIAGQLIYVDPSPNFVPLAYAPLFYYFSVPFAWVFG